MRVTVITPTIGKPHLKHCIESVRDQTYKDVEHMIIVDGQERWACAESVLHDAGFPRGKPNEHVLVLPYATGIDRYNGHRVYGAATYFADGDFHIWLDDDNMLEPTHIESLVNLVTEKNLDWAFSLRKIVDVDGNYLCHDDCESLGMWPSILHHTDHFVDVNCFFIKKQVAVGLSPVWYRKFREPGQVEIDRALSAVLMSKQNNLKYDCTRDYTVKYRVGNTTLSVQKEFFVTGNQRMMEKYKGALPWKTKYYQN